jgi:phosphate starvation-inducible membrane PsiE
VSVKLTLEICINKNSSRLTAVGRQAAALDSHSQNCLQTLVFFLSLPSFDETTELHLHAEKLTETVLHLNLEQFVVFFLFCVVLFGLVWCFSPLMRQPQNYF